MILLSLDEWLAANCGYLDQAVQDLPAKGDLPPFFAAMKNGTPMVLALDPLTHDQALAVDLFRAFLKSAGADQYTIIAAAWYVALGPELNRQEVNAVTRTIDRESTGGAFKGQRRECYSVTAGDRERTLTALSDVERDYKGKIPHLSRRTKGMPEGMFGHMTDLLVDRTMHRWTICPTSARAACARDQVHAT
jgi:hypothetical protein